MVFAASSVSPLHLVNPSARRPAAAARHDCLFLLLIVPLPYAWFNLLGPPIARLIDRFLTWQDVRGEVPQQPDARSPESGRRQGKKLRMDFFYFYPLPSLEFMSNFFRFTCIYF